MKRSKINKVIKDMEQLYREEGFHLPPFADWTPQEWQDKGHEYDEIRGNRGSSTFGIRVHNGTPDRKLLDGISSTKRSNMHRNCHFLR